jgi:GGDEF domain-containing protein
MPANEISVSACDLGLPKAILTAGWKSQLSPVRPAYGYLTVVLQDLLDDAALLLCDPLTGLVAYPSFEACLIAALPKLAPGGLHLAIGDVDDLRGYVNTVHAEDPTHFGHLAGNECMRRTGAATRRWAAQHLDGWPFAVCATFGGDEIIVAAAGRPYGAFVDALTALIAAIRVAAPRPCSFASATLLPTPQLSGPVEDAYRRLIARVDRTLFAHKAAVRSDGATLDGDLADAGVFDLWVGRE